MALTLPDNYTTPAGLTLANTYWRWVGLGIDVTTSNLNVTLYAYVSQDTFTAGKAPIGQRSYTVTGTDFAALVMAAPTGSTLSDAVSNPIYSYVTANDPLFANATGV